MWPQQRRRSVWFLSVWPFKFQTTFSWPRNFSCGQVVSFMFYNFPRMSKCQRPSVNVVEISIFTYFFIQTLISFVDDRSALGKESPIERFITFRRVNHLNASCASCRMRTGRGRWGQVFVGWIEVVFPLSSATRKCGPRRIEVWSVKCYLIVSREWFLLLLYALLWNLWRVIKKDYTVPQRL